MYRLPKRLYLLCAAIFIFGVSLFVRRVEHVRFHDAVQLFASGMICGAALTGTVIVLTGRLRYTADRRAPEQQPPPPETQHGGLTSG